MSHGPEYSERSPLLPPSEPVPYPAVSGTGIRRSVSALANAEYIVSVFEQEGTPIRPPKAVDDTAFMAEVDRVRESINEGVYPRMISVGTSGSYFALIREHDDVRIFGVFKPMDEEPYGNLNPKRVFLRRYFWWAMGRPCLIPNFSYLSEVGASFLDDRLSLGMVPKTRLIGLSSPSFHYLYQDRRRHEQGRPLPIKVGSLQQFLSGYENASTFLRRHGLPGRPRAVFEQDLERENSAHILSRRKQRAQLRMCFIAIKRFLLCRYGPGPYGSAAEEHEETCEDLVAPVSDDEFSWTERTWDEFRLELEKLVILDYLMRNTDRGLDNFMVRYDPHAPPGESSVRLGAIDNSLSFPHQHPRGLRDYPYGWLFLPTSVIGQPFSDKTRDIFLPFLSDPIWWRDTVAGLRAIFSQDAHFDEKTFQHQMDLMRGQGWNIVESLNAGNEGPIELCARQKQLVRQSLVMLTDDEIKAMHAIEYGPKPREQRRSHREAVSIDMGRRSTMSFISPIKSLPSMRSSVFGEGPSLEVAPLAIEIVEQMRSRGNDAGTSVDSLDLAAKKVPAKKRRHRVIVEHLVADKYRAWLSRF
ncbi:1-phosphatidylinositol 4-kinase [Malassezia cuniculi]|uniref:Phosphatidylinositol 4-kinase n=1 Tax=Malassezia cuniculi TaxID=948313 RepID=A0AAF0EXT6_9BASI|nr:1-phosphatidylinositol 4-kinase [Malassezia cuniculi]